MKKPPGMARDIGERLIATRAQLGLEQASFARKANLNTNAYNQYEAGKRVPDIVAGIFICETYNITLDWIYRGDPSGLDPRFWAELRKHVRRPGKA